MYSKKVPYKDFKGNPRNETIHFNLTETEVFKLLAEFQRVFNWRKAQEGDYRDLEPEEVVSFYTDFERIILAAWGVPSEDGRHFRKSGRYDYEESAIHNAFMVECVSNPEEVGKLLDNIIPAGLSDIIEKADKNLQELAAKEGNDNALQAEINRLRAELESGKTAE